MNRPHARRERSSDTMTATHKRAVMVLAAALIGLLPLLLLISFAVYALILLIPGDPALTLAGGAKADPAQVAHIRHALHLDQSFITQYARWLGHALTGDLGSPLFSRGTVVDGITHRFPITLTLAVGAMLVSLLIGIPTGIIAGTHPGSSRFMASSLR